MNFHLRVIIIESSKNISNKYIAFLMLTIRNNLKCREVIKLTNIYHIDEDELLRHKLQTNYVYSL